MFSFGYKAQLGTNKHGSASNTNKYAMVRVIHAVPTDITVDVEMDHRKLFFDVGYKDVTRYKPIRKGDRKVTVKVSGNNNTILWENFDIHENTTYTIVIQGLLGGSSSNNSETELSLNMFLDHNNLPDKGYAQVRFIHLSPKSPPVDVYTDKYLVFRDVEYGSTAISNPYMQFSSDAHHKILLKQAGQLENETDTNNQDTLTNITLLDPVNIDFEDQCVYTICAVGIYGSGTTPLKAILIKDWPYSTVNEGIEYEKDENMQFRDDKLSSSTVEALNNNTNEEPIQSSIRVIHNIGSPIDVCHNGNVKASNLTSNDLTNYIPLSSNTANRVVISDSINKKVYFDDNVPAVKGKRFTFALMKHPTNIGENIIKMHEHEITSTPKLYLINLTQDSVNGYRDTNKPLCHGKLPLKVVREGAFGKKEVNIPLQVPRSGNIALFISDNINIVSNA